MTHETQDICPCQSCTAARKSVETLQAEIAKSGIPSDKEGMNAWGDKAMQEISSGYARFRLMNPQLSVGELASTMASMTADVMISTDHVMKAELTPPDGFRVN